MQPAPVSPSLKAMAVTRFPLSFGESKLFGSFVFVVVMSHKPKWSVDVQTKWAYSTEVCLQKWIAADLLQKSFYRIVKDIGVPLHDFVGFQTY